ncbi:MAG: hypothetical protein NTV05_03545 [Acidobacteria bacterium]|nr:hypothetical protein [Acidobacteriota bacterium]
MIWSRLRGAVLSLALAGLALATGACQSNANNPYLQLGPTPTITTSTFTGTLTNSADAPVLRLTHTFTTTYSGTVTLSLTANQPDAALVVGFGIGAWDSATSTCGPLLAWNNSATQGATIIGNGLAGNFCAQVYDVGNLAVGAQTTYTLTVTYY